MTSEVPAADFGAALAIVGRLNKASLGKMESEHMNACLKAVLELRSPEEPLVEQAKPLLLLARVLVISPNR